MGMVQGLVFGDALMEKAKLMDGRMPRNKVQDFMEMEKKTDLKIAGDLAR